MNFDKTVLGTCLVVLILTVGASSAQAEGVLSGWEGHAELGVGYNTSWFHHSSSEYKWDNEGDCIGFSGRAYVKKSMTKRLAFLAQYAHFSHWNCGPPFNNNGESSLDHIGVAVRFKLF